MDGRPLASLLLIGAFLLAFAGVICVPLIGIARKMGYSGWIGLLALVPGLNIILAWALALREWPVERALRSGPGMDHRPVADVG